ncbi:MAG: ABC transporter ATP-binding protein [Bacteroidota bacterium]|nr:ABC transporter ATP-binding protein [Bacteroidota bacterium]
MISINKISKSFGKVQALQNINIDISNGELFGLIGPDGAGKSTLMRLITTLLIPEKGDISINNYDTVKDYKSIRQNIGYMPGRFSLYQDLSVEENLSFYANVFGSSIEENYDLVKEVYEQIAPFKKRLAGQLSGGMKQKLALSCALIHRPKILVLDEPTTGVDAVSRKEFWQLLKKIRNSGITIIVSTAYMDEASLCDRVALMQKGEILKVDTPKNVVDSFQKKIFTIKATNFYKLINNLRQAEFTYSVFPFGQYLHVIFKDDNQNIELVRNYLKDCGHEKIEITEVDAEIEDVFMYLM